MNLVISAANKAKKVAITSEKRDFHASRPAANKAKKVAITSTARRIPCRPPAANKAKKVAITSGKVCFSICFRRK